MALASFSTPAAPAGRPAAPVPARRRSSARCQPCTHRSLSARCSLRWQNRLEPQESRLSPAARSSFGASRAVQIGPTIAGRTRPAAFADMSPAFSGETRQAIMDDSATAAAGATRPAPSDDVAPARAGAVGRAKCGAAADDAAFSLSSAIGPTYPRTGPAGTLWPRPTEPHSEPQDPAWPRPAGWPPTGQGSATAARNPAATPTVVVGPAPASRCRLAAADIASAAALVSAIQLRAGHPTPESCRLPVRYPPLARSSGGQPRPRPVVVIPTTSPRLRALVPGACGHPRCASLAARLPARSPRSAVSAARSEDADQPACSPSA